MTSRLKFQSPMVNQENQRFAYTGTKSDQLLRVLNGVKPMSVTLLNKEVDSDWFVDQVQKTAESMGASVDISVLPDKGYDGSYTQVIVANQGTLEELFDLDALLGDYVDALGPTSRSALRRQFLTYRKFRLVEFADGWDVEDVPPWVTGLILGYPVKRTIKGYY